MNQWEYTTIVMALDSGVPALAGKLAESLQNLVNERNNLLEENEKLKAENEKLKATEPETSSSEAVVKKAAPKKATV